MHTQCWLPAVIFIIFDPLMGIATIYVLRKYGNDTTANNRDTETEMLNSEWDPIIMTTLIKKYFPSRLCTFVLV